jgi:uncharacterized membrane protein required for colicin V production
VLDFAKLPILPKEQVERIPPNREEARRAPPEVDLRSYPQRLPCQPLPGASAVNWLDAVFLGLMLWLTFAAFQAGFIREIVTLVAAIIGVAMAGLFYEDIAEDVLTFIDNDDLAAIVAFGSIFLAITLAGQAMAMVMKPTLRALQLGVFDQLGGAAFGFVKALIFIQVFVLVFITYPRWDLEEAIDDSFIASLMLENGAILENILPAAFDIAVENFVSGPDDASLSE